MDRRKRIKQTAIIVLGVVVLALLLWRLRVSPPVGVGGWATTNIFGPATLNILSNAEVGGGTTANPAPAISNVLATPAPNLPIQPVTNLPLSEQPPRPRGPLSTNLINTNGPVTVIDVPTADLVLTPPGVVVSSNSTEAASIQDRLGAANAQGGEIQISLSWNNYNDLDLHCIDPSGEEIWFNNRRSRHTGGELDVDKNANYPYTSNAVENIYWPVNHAPVGRYRVFVVYYAPHDPTNLTAFTVRTVVRNWKTFYFKSTIEFFGQHVSKLVCNLIYDPENPDPDKRYQFVP
jgi:hypothetical protein